MSLSCWKKLRGPLSAARNKGTIENENVSPADCPLFVCLCR
jgi:hypothetical protein